MTGLRGWDRDLGWPARAGDEQLVPPGEEDLLALVLKHLLLPGAEPPAAARWVYARWKPGVSICAAYELEWEGADQPAPLVGYKCYVADKADQLVARAESELRGEHEPARLANSVVLPEQHLHLWLESADRELPGVGRLLDMRRTKRLLADQGVFTPLRLRSHRSSLTRLRYRPEHRAVYRLDALLRGSQGCAVEERLAVRALTPATAARVVARRRALGPVCGLPELLANEERTGLLFERWFDGLNLLPAPGAERLAGAVLARLHGRPAPVEAPAIARLRPHDALLDWHPRLASLATALRGLEPVGEPGPRCWIHGDFHLDQLARGSRTEDPVLLDLDALAPGEAGDDLASWIADRLAEDAGCEFGDVACELLEAYEEGGGRAPPFARLRSLVARALVDRARGCLRRLECDAVARAECILERARELTHPVARRS